MAKGYVKFHDTSHEVMKELRKLSGRALRAGGKVAAKAIQNNTPKRSGRLEKAAGYRVRTGKDGTPFLELGFFSKKRARKANRAYFANPNWIEFGTKPHMISAGKKNRKGNIKRALSDGTRAFGRSVSHPAQAAKPFVKTTILSSIAEIRKAQEVGLSELTKKIEELTSIPDNYEVEDGESP